MNSIIKKALTLSLLLPLAGCWDFGSDKKNRKTKKSVSSRKHKGKSASPKTSCSHANCTHDHSNNHKTPDYHDLKEVESNKKNDLHNKSCSHTGCTKNHNETK